MLKLAKVVPLFKSGARNDIKNYRPISILPIFDKVIEKVIHKRVIMSYLDEFDILIPNQFGFQANKSTSSAILSLTHTLSAALKNNETCCAIFLDLAKAFDTVDHKILLKKLSKVGIRGPMLKWFESYLKSRYQCVLYYNELADTI